MKKNKIIAYDIVSAPSGMDLEHMVKIKNGTGFILWDRDKGGMEPKSIDGSKLEFALDVSIPKNKELLDKLMKELDGEDNNTTQSTE